MDAASRSNYVGNCHHKWGDAGAVGDVDYSIFGVQEKLYSTLATGMVLMLRIVLVVWKWWCSQ